VPDQWKQIRHWSLILIECCPRRSPPERLEAVAGRQLEERQFDRGIDQLQFDQGAWPNDTGKATGAPGAPQFSASRPAKLLITAHGRRVFDYSSSG